MSEATGEPVTAEPGSPGLGTIARRGAVAAVVSLVANAILVVAVTSVGVAPGFRPLSLPPVALLTIAGVVGATVVYWLLWGRVSDPDRTFTRLAAALLVVSFVPDVGLLVGDPAATVPGVVVLVAMHVIVAAVAVSVLTGRAGV